MSLFPAKEVGLEPLVHSQRHGHMLALHGPRSYFIVAAVTLSYSFNLSLEPAD